MSPPKHPLPATGRPKPPPDKSKFVQTCSRLSVFLKEKGNINFKFDATGVSAAKATTVDLLSSIDDGEVEDSKSLAQYVILDSSSSCQLEDSKPKSAQMTIFYQGQVLVLDDVPADRARDVMVMVMVMVMAKEKENRADEAPPVEVDVSGDLPIARRASLHKFLAKRKDRATVRQPDPLQNHSPGPRANQQHTFDLNM